MEQTSPTYRLDPQALGPQRRRGLWRSTLIYGGGGAIALAAVDRGDFSEAGIAGLIVGGAVALLLAEELDMPVMAALAQIAAGCRAAVGQVSYMQQAEPAPITEMDDLHRGLGQNCADCCV